MSHLRSRCAVTRATLRFSTSKNRPPAELGVHVHVERVEGDEVEYGVRVRMQQWSGGVNHTANAYLTTKRRGHIMV